MLERFTQDNKYSALLVYFSDKFVEDFISKYKLDIFSYKKYGVFNVNLRDTQMLSLNVDLLKLYIDNKNSSLLRLKLEEVFLSCLPHTGFISFLAAIHSTSINRIQFIIESNIDQIVTIDDICFLTKLTPAKLRLYFLKHYNKNPKQWVNEKRLQKSMVLLQTTNKSITQIAQDCGYATVSWFIDRFKDKYKYTPREIRQKI